MFLRVNHLNEGQGVNGRFDRDELLIQASLFNLFVDRFESCR